MLLDLQGASDVGLIEAASPSCSRGSLDLILSCLCLGCCLRGLLICALERKRFSLSFGGVAHHCILRVSLAQKQLAACTSRVSRDFDRLGKVNCQQIFFVFLNDGNSVANRCVDKVLKMRQIAFSHRMLISDQNFKLAGRVPLFPYHFINFDDCLVDVQTFQKLCRVGLLGPSVYLAIGGAAVHELIDLPMDG